MMSARFLISLLAATVLGVACRSPAPQSPRADSKPPSSAAAFHPQKLAEMDAAILQNISSNRLPAEFFGSSATGRATTARMVTDQSYQFAKR